MSTDQQTPDQDDGQTPLDELCDFIIEREETPEQLRDVARAVKRGVEEGEIDAT